MDNLWAPWRMKYIKEEHAESQSGCIFCDKLNEGNDKENLILYRGKLSFVLMNLYPYNNGHLMVVPNRHTSDFNGLTEPEMLEMNKLLQKCASVISAKMFPHGFNIGLNLGKVGGAGIADHLHWHIVPRWEADTNFMPVVADTRVIPQAIDDTYELLKEAINE